MNAVHGHVVLQEGGRGVPGLLISLYGSAADSRASGTTSSLEDAQRLGSMLSGPDGGFAFSYEPGDVAGAGRQLIDLLVVASAPEASLDGPDPVSESIASARRPRAAVREAVVLRVAAKDLRVRKVAVPGSGRAIDDTIARRRTTRRRTQELDRELGRMFAEDLGARRELQQRAREKMGPFFAALSSVPHRGSGPSRRYVAPTASVAEANRTAMRSAIEGRINKVSQSGRLGLTDAQLDQLRDSTGNIRHDVTPETLESLFRPKGLTPLVSLAHLDLTWLCGRLHRDVDDCIAALGTDGAGTGTDSTPQPEPSDNGNGEPVPDGPSPEPSPGDGSLDAADIPPLLNTLVANMSSPEDIHTLGISDRPGLKEVEQSVQAFSLHSGPADVPAFHDFHHVRLAFESIWTELFDGEVEGLGEQLYESLVEAGVDPNAYLVLPGETFNLIGPKGKSAKKAVDEHAPDVVARMFDITPEQWSALLAEGFGEQLEKLADDIHKIRVAPLTSEVELFGVKIAVPLPEGEIQYRDKMVRFLREQGNRMIRYADYLVMRPDRLDRFHEVLRDLTKALKEPYRFSVYAANGLERSVNFGIVASYRQVWTPVTYQVGELVKTVPLAPKETRRFTKKLVVRQTRADKEVENSLQSRKSERAETARAESEIIDKATRKTNFQASAKGGVDVGIADASASSGFSHDAGSESHEAKKEFREAVFKAAEEYKEERNLEVNVTDSTEATGEESGEISNPNDEIPVTYLFYELQRRYKVSEHLRKVTPVVLVAQEVPKPNQIDDDWLIAHDWILRRVLLDDSFVPALNYLASKVVGDEFALEEMYKNVQQQRRVVDDSQGGAGQHPRTGQPALRRARTVARKTCRGHPGGGRGDDIIPMPVGFVFGGGEAQSPEAMQVREEAARDAYERAGKLEKDIQARLEREVTALSASSDAYTKALSEHLNRRAQIARLRVHVKSNILYYMQAIWSHEPPDQRYFRLHEVPVPALKGKKTYTLEPDPEGVPAPPDWKPPLKVVMKCELDPQLRVRAA